MQNKEQAFLNRVRTALGKDAQIPADPALFDTRSAGELEALLQRTERTHKERMALVEVLKQAAAPLNLNIHITATSREAGKLIAELAKDTDTEWGENKMIATHDDPVVAALELDKWLTRDAIQVQVAALQQDEEPLAGKQRIREMVEASYLGVTGADWCVVDCAAVALFTGPGHGRSVSLVPSVHVAVVPLDRVLADLPELYAKLEQRGQLPASINFISGPSKTADIEAVMVHGAHGPREMHLVVVTE